MKKKLFSLCMATAIAITGAASVSAADEWMQETEMSGLHEIATYVMWIDTYDSLNEVMNSSDVCLVGTVVSQTVEKRSNLYFTHSYVEAENGEVYDVLQPGAVVGGDEVNVPYDSPLLETNDEYFLCLQETYDDGVYGQYYLISGGNQGYGVYNESNSAVYAVDLNNRSLFSSFTLNADNSNNIELSSDSIDDIQAPYATMSVTPANAMWDIWSGSRPQYYVTYDGINPTTSIRNGINSGLRAWSNLYSGSYTGTRLTVSQASSSSRANVNVLMTYTGVTNFAGSTTIYGTGETLEDSVLGNEYDVIEMVGITLNGSTNHTHTAGFWEAVACHEMGHAIGLDHNDGAANSIMKGSATEFYDIYGLTEPQYQDEMDLQDKYDTIDYNYS